MGLRSRGDWEEFDPEQVKSVIFSRAHSPDLELARKAAREANAVFEEVKAEVISVIEIELAEESDPFLTRLKGDLEKLEPLTIFDVEQRWAPKGQIITRDMLAMGQGNMVPPHVDVLAELASINHLFGICKAAADIYVRGASHLVRKNSKKP
jgi:hypothetical protein